MVAAMVAAFRSHDGPKLTLLTGMPTADDRDAFVEGTARFVSQLPPGLHQLYVHPSRTTDAVKRAISSWEQRAWEETLFTDPRVVKALGPDDAGYSPQASDRLATEARMGYRISHPGIVRVLDIYQAEATWYVVMEFVDGANLAAVLEAAGRVVWTQAAELGRRVGVALNAIHRAGFIHRDIKPANLLLQPDGSVKLIDLGLACPVDANGSP